MGEAANAISENTRLRYPDVPWRQVVDMRNLLAHGYRQVDPSIVWQVVVRDLPELETQIHEILDAPLEEG
ncbi:MAG: HepT-like ribonuclease domain-containing protein [Actinomycetota bacterium]|nr:HepT-like ribonuclease domain-containing protein [Actinomycetota bacterium]